MWSVFAASLSFELVESGGGMAGWGEKDVEKDSVEKAVAHAHGDAPHGTALTEKTEAVSRDISPPSHTPPDPQKYDDWLLQRRVRIRKPWTEFDELGADVDVGDSCCFGTRSVVGWE